METTPVKPPCGWGRIPLNGRSAKWSTYDDGITCHREGMARTDNPYRNGDARRLWWSGWDEGARRLREATLRRNFRTAYESATHGAPAYGPLDGA